MLIIKVRNENLDLIIYNLQKMQGKQGANSPTPNKQQNNAMQPQPHDDFDKQLNEGKRVLDLLHHQSSNPHQKTPEDQDQPNRESQEKMEGDPMQAFERSDNPKPQQFGEMQAQKDESISFSRNMNKKGSKMYQGCNCLKSKCSKNYCECFTQGRRCNEMCKCMGCENHSENQYRLRANIEVEGGQRACYCKKSNCLKKYCECYNNGAKCTNNCKCQECKNTEDQIDQQRPISKNAEQEQPKPQTQKQRSQQQIEQIHMKIDQIAKLTPPEYQDIVFSFLEYWLS